MKRLYLALGLVLSACSSDPGPVAPTPPPIITPPLITTPVSIYPNIHPGTTTWTLKDGSWSQSDYCSYGPATFDPATGMISFDRTTIQVLQQSRQTYLPYRMPNDHTAIVEARVQGLPWQVVTTVDPAYTLVERQTDMFIGEAANPGAVAQDPPEPYLTLNPVAGEVINTHSLITKPDGTMFWFDTRYQTIAVDVTFDGFEHATVTTLVENPGTDLITAYVWVFSGGDIAEEIIGRVGAGNVIASGNIARRTLMGVN